MDNNDFVLYEVAILNHKMREAAAVRELRDNGTEEEKWEYLLSEEYLIPPPKFNFTWTVCPPSLFED